MTEPLTRRELKLRLKELEKAEGNGTVLVSLYVTASKPMQAVVNQLNGEIQQAGNIKSRVVRQGVTDALTQILNTLRAVAVVPFPNGLAAFQSSDYGVVLVPPDPIPSNLYRCDNKFVLDPLREMVEDPTLYGLIVIDRAEVTFGFLRGRKVVHVRSVLSNLMGKHDAGGQSQRRFERTMENETVQFYRRAADMALAIFGPEMERLKGIIVGGPGHSKEDFLEEGNLRYDLKQKVMWQRPSTGYTNAEGLDELVRNAANTLRETAQQKEREILAEFFTQTKRDSGLVTYGYADVEAALVNALVTKLIIYEDLDPEQYDRLTALARDTGAAWVVVSGDTDLGKQFVQGFGGLGAILRYSVQ